MHQRAGWRISWSGRWRRSRSPRKARRSTPTGLASWREGVKVRNVLLGSLKEAVQSRCHPEVQKAEGWSPGIASPGLILQPRILTDTVALILLRTSNIVFLLPYIICRSTLHIWWWDRSQLPNGTPDLQDFRLGRSSICRSFREFGSEQTNRNVNNFHKD